MGDVGSLALGAAMAGLALLTHTILLLPILGGLYVVETLSVIAQVISFRCFHRRVLRMAPIHHHFEVGGWPEFTVIVRFWLLAGLLVALGLGIFYADFIHIPGVARLMRVLVVGLAGDGRASVVVVHARGRSRGRPCSRTGRTAAPRSPTTAPRPSRPSPRARRWSRRPTPRRSRPRRGAAADLVVPSPGVRPDHPALAAPRTPRACRCAPRSTSPPNGSAARPDAPAARRGHRHQRQDDGHHARSTRCCAPRASRASRPGNIGRPLLDAAGDDVDGRRRRGLVVPARVHDRRVRARRRGAAQRGRGPPRLARHAPRRTRRPRRWCSRTRAPTTLLVVNADDPVASGARRVGRDPDGSRASSPARPTRTASACRDGSCSRARAASCSRRARIRRAARRRQRPGRGRGRGHRRGRRRRRDRRGRSPASDGLPHRVQLVAERERRALLRRLEGDEPARHRRARSRASTTWC